MSEDGDLLNDVVARLWQVREQLGPDVYRAAVRAALHAIEAAALEQVTRAPEFLWYRSCGLAVSVAWGLWHHQECLERTAVLNRDVDQGGLPASHI